MFQFSPLAPVSLCIQERVTAYYGCRVSPFGHLRITAYVRLPEAFRSLSRPSSPVRAKASTVRPFPLDRIVYVSTRDTCFRTPPKVLFLSVTTPFPFTRIVNDSSLGGGAILVRSTCESLSAPEGAYSAFSERR